MLYFVGSHYLVALHVEDLITSHRLTAALISFGLSVSSLKIQY